MSARRVQCIWRREGLKVPFASRKTMASGCVTNVFDNVLLPMSWDGQFCNRTLNLLTQSKRASESDALRLSTRPYLFPITDQRIAQTVLEPTEPRFVVMPLDEPVTENWLADLL